MMPTGFISAARAGRGAGGEEGGGKDGKSRRVLAEVARCRASLPRSRRSVGSQLLARVEVLVGERAGLRTDGGVFLLPVASVKVSQTRCQTQDD